MVSQSIDDVRKARGRPAVGATPVTVRLPPPTLAVVDAWAAKRGVTRPAAIRAMIEAMVVLGGLDDAPEPKRREKTKPKG